AGAYYLGSRLSGSMEIPQLNILLESSRAISERAAALYDRDRAEAERIAFTSGVPDLIANGQARKLQLLLESSARLAELDSLIVTDADGNEVLGMLRGEGESVDYTVSNGTDLSSEAIIRAAAVENVAGTTALLRTPNGLMLYTAVPVYDGKELAGVALVGRRFQTVIEELQGSGVAEIAVYGQDGGLLQTSLELAVAGDTSPLEIAPELFNQSLASLPNQVPVQGVQIGGTTYQTAYFPLRFGPETLGVVAAFAPDNIPFVTEMGRQLTSLVMASLAGVIVIAVFFAMNMMVIRRINRVTHTAQALTAGNSFVRTGMKPVDEIGALGRSLDQYANYVQERQDALRVSLRRQRREVEHLMAVLESLPDGIIVQDLDGRVMVMNEQAKKLLGSQRVFRSAGLHELTAAMTEPLGPSVTPGLYSLGDPHQVELEGKMLSAQIAAVIDLANIRVGTVIVLRDITADVRRERAYQTVLTRVEQEVQKPMVETVRAESAQQPVNALARELSRHAVALQKLVVEMRDLNMADAPVVREGQRPLHLETLLWTCANEWRQVASAANLTLDVVIEKKGLYILGDERRLRWAIGNILDNAIKFTLPGGKLTLEIKGEGEGRANMRVRDNGVGITPDDLPHVFTRFYRGTPKAVDGHILLVPGTGQGLSIAKQIIEAHGGMIQIKSKPSVGTAVYFTLPLTATVTMELPHLQMDMEGETVRLQSDEI
ncbi:MAG: PAS domain-containing protein, partial [Anaerolineae bacterium]|nr:PAS domain-containing protein [Anaerolineae bacterium]